MVPLIQTVHNFNASLIRGNLTARAFHVDGAVIMMRDILFSRSYTNSSHP
jgi:hypothetical protein